MEEKTGKLAKGATYTRKYLKKKKKGIKAGQSTDYWEGISNLGV